MKGRKEAGRRGGGEEKLQVRSPDPLFEFLSTMYCEGKSCVVCRFLTTTQYRKRYLAQVA